MNAGHDVVLKYCKTAIMIVAVIFVALTLVPFHEVKSILNGLSPDNNSSILTPSTIVVFRAFFIVTALILLAYVHGKKGWVKLYAFLLASLYGVICSAQILGIFGVYRLVLVLPITVGVALFLFVLYEKYWSTGFYDSVFHRSANTKGRFLDYGFWTVGTILLLFLILAPLVLWPFSQINRTLAWDVGIYHFPKALELANTGSAWDLTISYGEYPFGYESLFAFVALLNRSGMLFGSIHAIGVLFFMLTFWLLLCRYTNLPVGFNFLIVVCLLISGLFWRDKLYNIWWIYRIVLYNTIGKNDLFLAAGILAILLHVPFDLKTKINTWHLLGMASTTMIALSVKPNAIFIIVPSWVLAFFVYFRGENRVDILPKIGSLFPYALMIIPGALWVGRNLIAQGTVFSSGVLQLQGQSILNNLTNPKLYSGMSPTMIVVLIVMAGSCFMTFRHSRMSWIFICAFLILFFSFISTPASGFIHASDETANFSWRFGVALLTFTCVAIIIWIEPWLAKGLQWLFNRTDIIHLILSALMVGLALWTTWSWRWFFWPDLSNSIVLEDQYSKPVGADGYNSAFNYLHKNVTHSVIWVENGLPYYAYGYGFTNSTTRLKSPDYYVFLQTEWQKGIYGYPPDLNSEEWNNTWQLEYEDGEGRIYKRK